MTTIAPLLRAKLSDETQILEGFRAEAWAVCDRVPEAVAFPETEEEVASILRLCRSQGWRCLPAGKGTWLFGGQPPSRVDVVMSMTRMDRVLEYEPADLTMTCEAGIGLDLLARRTNPGGQWLPLDPPGLPRGTLGAMVATASTGSLQAGFGTVRDHVLGATLITTDGDRLHLGGRVVKNVAGFDLLRMITGSWGSLGVLTSITVRVHPRPAVDRAILFSSAGDLPLGDLAARLARLPVPIGALDLLVPGEAERAGPGATPLVVVRVADSVAVADEVLRAVRAAAPDPPDQILEGPDALKLFHNVQAVEEGAEMVLRLRALPDKLTRLLELSEVVRDLVDPNRGFGMREAAHAHTGVLRLIVSRLLRGEGWLERVQGVVTGLRALVEAEGGTLRVSQGPPRLLEAVGSWGAAGAEAIIVQGLKEHFDPETVLSPGRMGVV
jgi:glycolate dehydrogenase FAD-binding subunit